MLFVDAVTLVLTLWLSFSIRLGLWYVPDNDFIFWLFFAAPVIGVIIFLRFGLYRSVTRYANLNALWTIAQAVSLYALVWGTIFLAGDNIPRSVVLINWLLSVLGIMCLRMSARWLLSLKRSDINRKRTLIYGVGDAGMQLAGALGHSSEYRLIGFVDEEKEFLHTQILGLDVYPANSISAVINKLKIEEVLLAIPSASRAKRFDIVSALETHSVKVRMLPRLGDLAGGKVTSDDLQEINIEDLLGRDAVLPNQKLLSRNIAGKIVMVTGAGGSIGSEICRQTLSLKPKALILYEMSELALYTIEKEFSDNGAHHIDIYPVLGSVNNRSRLNSIFKHFEVDTVYHAAAYKHVPLVEFNNAEGVENNLFGTLNCAQAAIDGGVETFVLISTDKAVRPTNTMGATKRCAELVLQALSEKQNDTKFTMVRFGNVLNSSGSVIPLFTKQIKEGGPVTVTDKELRVIL